VQKRLHDPILLSIDGKFICPSECFFEEDRGRIDTNKQLGEETAIDKGVIHRVPEEWRSSKLEATTQGAKRILRDSSLAQFPPIRFTALRTTGAPA
jgi:hypothetical protein